MGSWLSREGQLGRFSLRLLLGGLDSLFLALGLTWIQSRDWHSDSRFVGDYESFVIASLLVQTLTVAATVLLTGSILGFLLMSFRADRQEDEDTQGADWYR